VLHNLQQPWYEFLLICLGVFLSITVIFFMLVFGVMSVVVSLRDRSDHDTPRTTDRHD
jgi:hypothetical protein